MRTLIPALAIGLAACEAPAVEEPPPPLAIEATFDPYAGTLFEGPQPGRAGSVSDDPAEALVLSYEAFYVGELREDLLEPIARRTRLVFHSPSKYLLTPTTVLARGAFLASGERAAELRERLRGAPLGPGEARFRGAAALPNHVTALVSATPPVAGDLREMQFMIGRRGTGVAPDLAVRVLGETAVWSRVAIAEITTDQPLYTSRRELRLEALVLDEEADLSSGPVAVAVRNTKGEPGVLVLVVEALPAPRPADEGWSAHAEAVARCLELVDQAARDSDRAVQPLRDALQAQHVLADAAAGLDDPGSLRAALAHLAESTGAELTADLALVGERELLEEIVRSAAENGAEIDDSLEQYGWALERGAVLACSARLESSELGHAEAMLLGLHFGEAGHYPGRLRDAALACEDRAAFLDRIVALHLEFLESANPATRVNATDWLDSQGRGVPGYDPVGRAEERRAALGAYRAGAGGP